MSVRSIATESLCQSRRIRGGVFSRVVWVLMGVIGLAGCDQKTKPQPTIPTPTPSPVPMPTPVPTPTPTPVPTPLPTPYVPQKTLNLGSIFNGIHFKAKLETSLGTTATAERESPDGYSVEVTVKVNVPKPHQSIADLRKLNEKIDTVLPGLKAMLGSAKVSPVFDDLYRRKVTTIRSSMDRLDQLITRHNFFDCETILELQNPTTKRRALLIQADMDVDTDGTDGDRMPLVEGGSRTFQPFTSYRWKKRTPNPNPCVAIWEKRIAENESRIRDSKTSAAEILRMKADNSRLRAEIRDLQSFSFLIGAADPFIVLPSQMFTIGKSAFEPHMGDYCVVVIGDIFYPAIIGDAGPRAKMGEASLRLCKQVSARSNGETRPVNDLKATYLIFPNSRDKTWEPPDLKAWYVRCDALLKEFDEYAGELFWWEDITKPAPPPAPVLPPAPPPADSAVPIPNGPPPPAPKAEPTSPPNRKERRG